MLYQSKITGYGEMAQELWRENMMVLFNDNAPAQLAEIAVLLRPAPLSAEIAVGDTVVIGNRSYLVTAVGEEANHTFESMGHCTLRFEGKDTATLPGEIQLEGQIPPLEKDVDFLILKK